MRHDIDLKTEEECKTYEEASALLGKLLEDLKTQNMLRQTTREEKRRFLSILWNTWGFQCAFNEMSRQYDPNNFGNFVAKTGLTKETLVCAFVSQVLGNLLICYESLIKLPLVFFLDKKCGVRKTTTLENLLTRLETISPSFVEGINRMMNKAFRNAVAHGSARANRS